MAGAEGFEPPLAVLETAGLPLNLRPYRIFCVCRPLQTDTFSLLDFRAAVLLDLAVRLVLPAVRTELLHLQPFGGGFLILRVRVVPVLALGALERNDFPRHSLPSTR